jgi:hypothetical protein
VKKKGKPTREFQATIPPSMMGDSSVATGMRRMFLRQMSARSRQRDPQRLVPGRLPARSHPFTSAGRTAANNESEAMISEVDRNAVNMSLAAIPHARDCGRVVHPTNSEQSIGYTERRFTFVADTRLGISDATRAEPKVPSCLFI